MSTPLVDAGSLDDAARLALRRRLQAGGAVIFPTETFFGIGCDALNADAVAGIYQAKGREATKPLPVIAADPAMAARFCELDGVDERLLSFWPGPLTLLLRARAAFAPGLTDAQGRVALRVSSHPAAVLLSRDLVRGPVTATSANLRGLEPAVSVDGLDPEIVRRVGLVLDMPPAPSGGEPSTIVSVRGDGGVMLHREGAVPAQLLAAKGLRLLRA